MEPADGLAAALGVRVTLEHVGGEVLCAWVVHGVHADRLRAVVLSHTHRAAQANLQAGTSTTTEEVDNDLIGLRVEAESVLGFEIEGVFLLLCGHWGSSPGIFAGYISRLESGMLNDCGKELLKPWMSVQNVVLIGSLIFMIALFKPTSSEVASWVQAVGSIAAIWGALSIGRKQIANQIEMSHKERVERTKSFYAVVEGAVDALTKIGNVSSKKPSLEAYDIFINNYFGERFKISLHMLKGVPAHDLGSYELVMAYSKILSSMTYVSLLLAELSEAIGTGLGRKPPGWMSNTYGLIELHSSMAQRAWAEFQEVSD